MRDPRISADQKPPGTTSGIYGTLYCAFATVAVGFPRHGEPIDMRALSSATSTDVCNGEFTAE